MTLPLRMVTIVGARPQLIKAGAVSRAVAEAAAADVGRIIEERILHTGQHYDAAMSHVFFDELKLPRPDKNLEIGSGPHGRQTGRMLERIETYLEADRPDLVLVYGDTNSTLAGALAAAKLGLPIAHVEAGLRSFNRAMPEEINRELTDRLARWLFCPTPAAEANLRAEGVRQGIEPVGDVMYDSALHFAPASRAVEAGLLDRFELTAGGYLLATIHRAENVDDPVRLTSIARGLASIARPGRPVILPLHPRTAQRLKAAGLDMARSVRLVPPVSYLEMIALERNAAIVLTDSGGVQKEAFFYRVPCITLRRETEWVETVAAGGNRLSEPDAEPLSQAVEAMLGLRIESDAVEQLYGAGDAAKKIVRIITESF